VRSHNPLHVAAHEWKLLFVDIQKCRTWGDRLLLLVMPPEWFGEHGTAKERNFYPASKRQVADANLE
jgi:hypothetical protein